MSHIAESICRREQQCLLLSRGNFSVRAYAKTDLAEQVAYHSAITYRIGGSKCALYITAPTRVTKHKRGLAEFGVIEPLPQITHRIFTLKKIKEVRVNL